MTRGRNRVDKLYLILALFILLNLLAGILRVLRGPTLQDRMLTAQLFGTTGVAILLILSEATSVPALRDVALVFALLGAVAVVAFVRGASGPEEDEPEPRREP
jgi:multicomponent Na+:H+ antiporter subunit F